MRYSRASFLLALCEAVLPTDAIVAVVPEADGIFFLRAAAGRAAIAEAEPIRWRKPLQIHGRWRRLDIWRWHWRLRRRLRDGRGLRYPRARGARGDDADRGHPLRGDRR